MPTPIDTLVHHTAPTGTAQQSDLVLASDAERDVVADRVRTAYAEGRLTSDELDQRLARALSARTRAALVPVTADLPPAIAPATGSGAPARRAGAPACRSPQRGRQLSWTIYGATAATCLAIWVTVALLGGGAYFWPIWVLVPWGPILTVGTLTGRRRANGLLVVGRPGTGCHHAARISGCESHLTPR